MVNFKQSRGPNSLSSALAAPDVVVVVSKEDGTEKYISKIDRIEYDDDDGGARDGFVSRCGTHCRLRVVDRDDFDRRRRGRGEGGNGERRSSQTTDEALVHPSAREALKTPTVARSGGGKDGGSTVRFVADSNVERGIVVMTSAQRYNLRAGLDREMEFETCEVDEETPLVDATIELCRLPSQTTTTTTTTTTTKVESDTAREMVRRAFGAIGRVLTVSEVFVIRVDGVECRARVAEVNVAPAEEESIGYHCFRGRVGAETTFYVKSSDEASLFIENNRGKERSVRLAKRDTVYVNTRDGETFPVRRRLLRGCISLTSAVRRAGELRENDEDDDDDNFVTADVDVDTDVFDRVLIFLEALALKRDPPRYDIRITESLADAAETLGCRDLREYCAEKLGAHASRIREYEWDEICAHNAAGGVWLVIDGMVLDVKRWLPEHPGGDVIIPNQSLGLDAARHFEMYHSSRESFLYLKEFYIGEVCARDRRDGRVPVPEPPASEDFLRQLRLYTTFRFAPENAEKTTRAHLGQTN